MEEHAYFAPSASSRWILCPASLLLSESFKEAPQSTYAHEGSVCHAIAAECLTKHIAVSDYAGKIVDGVAMEEDLISGIQMYVDEIRGLTKEYKAIGGKIEHKVKLTDNCWGTADALLWNEGLALISDLKMGKGVIVPAVDNTQLMLYAVGCLMWLMETHGIKPQKVILVIIQPRTINPIRIHEMQRSELADWYIKTVTPIFQDYKHSPKETWKCNPGEVQCRWCPVSPTCVAQGNKLINDAQMAFKPFTGVETPVIPAEEGILQVTEVVEYKKVFKHIQNWMKDIDTFLKEKALIGENIPGFKLVEGRSNRKWKADEQQVVAFLRKLNTEPYIRALLTPPAAEKVLGKKIAEANNLAALITKPPGSPILVPESDGRPEMQINVEAEFEEFVPNDEPILVDSPKDGKEVKAMSALDRMKMAPLDDEPESKPEPEQKTGNIKTQEAINNMVQTASGGDPASIVASVERHPETQTPPNKTTKRYKVFELGKGGRPYISKVATELGCTENMIKMHLRYINERDGFGYKVYSDGTYTVG